MTLLDENIRSFTLFRPIMKATATPKIPLRSWNYMCNYLKVSLVHVADKRCQVR